MHHFVYGLHEAIKEALLSSTVSRFTQMFKVIPSSFHRSRIVFCCFPSSQPVIEESGFSSSVDRWAMFQTLQLEIYSTTDCAAGIVNASVQLAHCSSLCSHRLSSLCSQSLEHLFIFSICQAYKVNKENWNNVGGKVEIFLPT